MSLRSMRFAVFVIASAVIIAGVGGYLSLQPKPDRPAAAPARVALTPTGAALIGLRARAPAITPTPTPQEAAALQELITAEARDVADATPTPAPSEGAPAPEIDAPQPPRRPVDLASALELPLPPRRPADLLASLEAAPPAADAKAAAEPLVAAPQPPARPHDAVAAPAPEPPAQPQNAAAQPTSPSTAESPPRPPAEAIAEKPAQPVHFTMGAPAYVRIFKKESELELWLKVNGRYALYRTYSICKWSGRLGPKTKEADYQSPEGFYSVSAKQLNPHSKYHLAFDVGYPNAFDRQNSRTGALVMVHGGCKSVGCFAMTDQGVDEIYRVVAAALTNGQREVPVHIFPFRMTDQAIARETGASKNGLLAFLATENDSTPQWAGFWSNLKEGYDIFERTGEPPTAYACGDHYAFGAKGNACTKIAGW